MNRDIFGLIYAGENNLNLRELVAMRSLAALPVGGRYRAIDFPLSNMVNTGIKKVGVITERNYHSLMDHIGSGKDWDMNKRNGGLLLLPPFDNNENRGNYRGLLDALSGAMFYLRRAKEEYCLLCGSYTVYNTNYKEMIDFHMKSGADITMLYNIEDSGSREHFKDVVIDTDETGRVTDMKFNRTVSGRHKMGMDIYLLKRDLLVYLVEEAVSRGRYGLIEDILLPGMNKLKIYGYEYSGYVGRIVSVASYYKTNMDILDPAVHGSVFRDENKIYTKIKDEIPVKYCEGSCVKNSLIANGSIIEGHVENSILFRGVHVRKGAVIKNSIVMQASDVGAQSLLEHVILDKSVVVRDSRRLIGDENFPIIIRKGAVV